MNLKGYLFVLTVCSMTLFFGYAFAVPHTHPSKRENKKIYAIVAATAFMVAVTSLIALLALIRYEED